MNKMLKNYIASCKLLLHLLRELGIDWPSVHADLEMVKDNLRQNTTFVLENEKEIISTITVCYAWSSVKPISGYPFVWWFATRPTYDGQGYGSQLLKYVEETFYAIL